MRKIMKHELVRSSKRLSLHQRHAPERVGITLGPGGWVDVDTLLSGLARHVFPLSRANLDAVMAGNDKSRFAFDETGTRIRANQGHSVEVDLALPVSRPPDRLYHGTVERFLPAIMREGLLAMKRHDVHLSATTDTRSASARGGANPSFWKWRPAPWSRRDTSSGSVRTTSG
jgi:putative RNA 2'-phosphotransferase